MSLATSLAVKPLSPALGAEIVGLDLRQELGAGTVADILDTWHQHLVLVFRDQQLSEDEQIRFARHFGVLEKRRRPSEARNEAAMIKYPELTMLVSNIRENGKLIGSLPDGEMHFHSDQCHQECPAMASMLCALEVPRTGGNTLFANAYLAYETLPDAVKRRIEGRKALNAYDYDNASTRRGTRLREGIPSCWHPIVRTHPATGRKALYINRLMTVAIQGLSESESDELLNTLFDHQEQREFIYEHVWRPHDLVMWDNRCALHARTDFSAAERRLLRRLTILGEKPV